MEQTDINFKYLLSMQEATREAPCESWDRHVIPCWIVSFSYREQRDQSISEIQVMKSFIHATKNTCWSYFSFSLGGFNTEGNPPCTNKSYLSLYKASWTSYMDDVSGFLYSDIIFKSSSFHLFLIYFSDGKSRFTFLTNGPTWGQAWVTDDFRLRVSQNFTTLEQKKTVRGKEREWGVLSNGTNQVKNPILVSLVYNQKYQSSVTLTIVSESCQRSFLNLSTAPAVAIETSSLR